MTWDRISSELSHEKSSQKKVRVRGSVQTFGCFQQTPGTCVSSPGTSCTSTFVHWLLWISIQRIFAKKSWVVPKRNLRSEAGLLFGCTRVYPPVVKMIGHRTVCQCILKIRWPTFKKVHLPLQMFDCWRSPSIPSALFVAFVKGSEMKWLQATAVVSGDDSCSEWMGMNAKCGWIITLPLYHSQRRRQFFVGLTKRADDGYTLNQLSVKATTDPDMNQLYQFQLKNTNRWVKIGSLTEKLLTSDARFCESNSIFDANVMIGCFGSTRSTSKNQPPPWGHKIQTENWLKIGMFDLIYIPYLPSYTWRRWPLDQSGRQQGPQVENGLLISPAWTMPFTNEEYGSIIFQWNWRPTWVTRISDWWLCSRL